MTNLFERVLKSRGLDDPKKRQAFLNPSYEAYHDPFLLPDMDKAVERLVAARQKDEFITIYGDYDIDGLTATSVLLDAFSSFGFSRVEAFIPNRFVEGYGLTMDAVERIAKTGTTLVVTVDCGSLSEREIIRAKELGVDIIVTDHHNVAPTQPPAIGVVNPKRLLQDYPDDYEVFELKADSSLQGKIYPFLDLAGVGVAFKLVQALQTRLEGLPKGQEKWLLDLVALGTVCDIVSLKNENRAIVFWGLKVLAKTRRPGLLALMRVSGVEPSKVTARSLGFGLGPRMNAAGRLETATHALEMLVATDGLFALEKAQQLNELNQSRRTQQDEIFKAAIIEAERYADLPVLVVSSRGWNHGIIGIVAAKLLERYKKPTYVLEEMETEAKGSARSYGDFSAADAIRASDDIITKGGGHKMAAGVTLPVKNIPAFRARVNQFYKSLGLQNQAAQLLPKADTEAKLHEVDEALVHQLSQLEPFGSANKEPVLYARSLTAMYVKRMGAEAQHVKLELRDESGVSMQFLAFNAPEHFFVEPGDVVNIWFQPDINEWQGRRTVEGRLLHLENCD
ncbi:single-stranded DNA exonuclease RecJ [Candidatus Saccharibacteria bacterium]|nr:single-stranded DNA exonuclease RecJ [Candidatus Saccharibacteria bacterium]